MQRKELRKATVQAASRVIPLSLLRLGFYQHWARAAWNRHRTMSRHSAQYMQGHTDAKKPRAELFSFSFFGTCSSLGCALRSRTLATAEKKVCQEAATCFRLIRSMRFVYGNNRTALRDPQRANAPAAIESEGRTCMCTAAAARPNAPRRGPLSLSPSIHSVL